MTPICQAYITREHDLVLVSDPDIFHTYSTHSGIEAIRSVEVSTLFYLHDFILTAVNESVADGKVFILDESFGISRVSRVFLQIKGSSPKLTAELVFKHDLSTCGDRSFRIEYPTVQGLMAYLSSVDKKLDKLTSDLTMGDIC